MDQGIASSAIQSFVDAVEERNLGVHSLMLVRNGILVAEGWWKPYASHLPHSMFSKGAENRAFLHNFNGLEVMRLRN